MQQDKYFSKEYFLKAITLNKKALLFNDVQYVKLTEA